MRVLVCGGREFWDGPRIYAVLDTIHALYTIDCIIHGGARGADTLAGAWAKDHRVEEDVHEADWARHGRKAGPIRNHEMLSIAQPDLVVAFPGGPGTADMIERVKKSGHKLIDLTMSRPGR